MSFGDGSKRLRGYVHYVVLGLLFFALFLIQYVFDLLPAVGNARAHLLLPTLIFTAMFLREWDGAVFGLVVGALIDCVSAGSVCFHTLLLMVFGCAAGLLVTYYFNNNILTALLLGGGFTGLYLLLHWLWFTVLAGRGASGGYLLHTLLPSLLYTTLLSVPIYLLMRAVIKRLVRRQL